MRNQLRLRLNLVISNTEAQRLYVQYSEASNAGIDPPGEHCIVRQVIDQRYAPVRSGRIPC